MTSPKERLNDVFNACAGKVVSLYEVQELIEKNLETRLTPQQTQTVRDHIEDYYAINFEKLRGDKQLVDTLVAAAGDGTIGMYNASANGFPIPFANVKLIELLQEFREAAFSGQFIEACADALEQSRDFRDEIKVDLKRGKVDGIKPSQIPGR